MATTSRAPAPPAPGHGGYLEGKGENMGLDFERLESITIKLEHRKNGKNGYLVATCPELDGLTTQASSLMKIFYNLAAALALEEKWSREKESILTEAREDAGRRGFGS